MRFDFELKDFVEQSYRSEELAVVGSDFVFTWSEFELKVNELASALSEKKVKNGEIPVILFGHKSANMLVGMYACMKLEIPYIPIDEIYPKDRIEKVKEIAHVNWIINTSSEELGLDQSAEYFVSEKKIKYHSWSNLSAKESKTSSLDPLVYIIFTSGSTGEPKGVQISTEAIQSFCRWMCQDFGFSDKDVFINTAVLSFDLSVFEVMTFGALGACIVLNDKMTNSNPQLLMDRVDQYDGTIWVSTPSFALIFSRLEANAVMKSLRHFLFCGEVLPNNLASALLKNFRQAKVWNTYGPTEATVATTLVEITTEIEAKYNPLPVGKSKMESELIIENGEIIIKGPNVSKGYLNRPDLNAEKFIMIDGERAFKTGDEGYLENNMLFFSGRNDDLVKLHGYRIELNEINANILKLEVVENSATIALKRNGEVKKIVALVQLREGSTSTEVKEWIQKKLSDNLPTYMIPSDFKFVSGIPLNQNGKADKKLLTEMYLNT
jgi:D-alanine--poly(phosphoribitol) ligase subunit 1